MSVNLSYVECTSEKLWRMLRSHEIRLTFYTENTLHKLLCKPKIKLTFYTENTLCKLLCKPKNRVATKDKNNIVYEVDCSNCEAVYFGESKRSLP